MSVISISIYIIIIRKKITTIFFRAQENCLNIKNSIIDLLFYKISIPPGTLPKTMNTNPTNPANFHLSFPQVILGRVSLTAKTTDW